MTLDPKKGERAILIKNSEGDWGILVARWDGMRRGIPGKRGNNHYYNRPRQYTAVFNGRKNDNFQMKNCNFFLTFA